MKDYFKISALPVLFASLCCFSPIVLVMFGLSSVSFASSLGESLYGDHKWIFRGLGLFFLAISLFLYFKKKGLCTLDQAKKNKGSILNTILLSLIVSVLVYIFWLYLVLHYWGAFLNIWEY